MKLIRLYLSYVKQTDQGRDYEPSRITKKTCRIEGIDSKNKERVCLIARVLELF